MLFLLPARSRVFLGWTWGSPSLLGLNLVLLAWVVRPSLSAVCYSFTNSDLSPVGTAIFVVSISIFWKVFQKLDFVGLFIYHIKGKWQVCLLFTSCTYVDKNINFPLFHVAKAWLDFVPSNGGYLDAVTIILPQHHAYWPHLEYSIILNVISVGRFMCLLANYLGWTIAWHQFDYSTIQCRTCIPLHV